MDSFIDTVNALRSAALKDSMEGKEPNQLIAWTLSPEWVKPAIRTTESMLKQDGRASWRLNHDPELSTDSVIHGEFA